MTRRTHTTKLTRLAIEDSNVYFSKYFTERMKYIFTNERLSKDFKTTLWGKQRIRIH